MTDNYLKFMVTPRGFEPPTCPLGGGCSIQLSHGAAKTVLPACGKNGKVAVRHLKR